VKPEVLILGSGACAWRLARNLATRGVAVCLAGAKPVAASHDGIQLLEGALPARCNGYAGDFEVHLKQNGDAITKRVAAIAVSTEETRRPDFSAYGLSPSSRVQDLSTLEEQLAQKPVHNLFAPGDRVVFLNGWQKDSHPAVTARVLAACLKLQESKAVQTFLITGNLKVAASGLEAACQAAKAAGTVFIKCTDHYPGAQTLPDGRIRIDYWDELTREPYELKADCVIVDETPGPDPGLSDTARDLGLEQDRLGFAQGDNVRRMSNLTNRRGIFIAGASRAVLTSEEIDRDADQAALEIMTFLSDGDREDLPLVQIDPGRCARCLTCHRICPHAAIQIGSHMAVVPQACQSCGICAAGCPARAIDVDGLQIREAFDGPTRPPTGADKETSDPRIALICCSRSAGLARKLAIAGGHIPAPGVQVIEVPCGGSVSVNHLLSAFEAGADGVLLITCHGDNCKSQQGSGQARKRAAAALQALTTCGMESERLQVATLAANMGVEFIRITKAFHRKIKDLGPWVSE